MVHTVLANNLTVADLRRRSGRPPRTFPIDTPLRTLRRQLSRDRWRGRAFVIDGDRHVIGVIEVERLAAWLFPMDAAAQHADGTATLRLNRMSATRVADLVGAAPACVRDQTPVRDLIAILIRERAAEAPVVDEQGRLIGQVDLEQVLSACASPAEGHPP